MTYNSKFPSLKLILSSLLVSFATTFHFGYQLLIPNPAQNAFLKFVNGSMHKMNMRPTESKVELIWGIIVALLFIGSILGAFTTRFLGDKFGKKTSIILCSIGLGLSAGISLLSKKLDSFIVFAIGRFLIGFFLGPTYSLAPLYMQECSPLHCRGFVNMAMGLMVVSGTLTGAITAMEEIFGTFDHWWILYAFEIAALAIATCILPFLYESPMYLLKRGKEDEARKSIVFYHGLEEFDVEKVIMSLKENLKKNTKSLPMLGVRRDWITWRGTMLGAITGFIVGMSGVDVLNSFAINIMIDCGLTQLSASLAQVGINSISVIAIICSSFIIDKVGRRPFLLVSLLIIIICDVIYAGLLETYKYYPHTIIGVFVVITNAIFSFFFGLGPQSLCFFVASEMVADDAKPAVQSYAAFFAMGSGAVAVGLYVPLKNLITRSWAYFVLFAIPCTIFEIIFYFNLPETKNRTFEQVVDEIEKLPSLCGLCNHELEGKRSRKDSLIENLSCL